MIEGLQKAFENRLRLGIMGLLMINEKISFNDLKDKLGATDGNLASHINALEKIQFIAVEKQIKNKKTLTNYNITHKGKLAFQMHLKALETLIRNAR